MYYSLFTIFCGIVLANVVKLHNSVFSSFRAICGKRFCKISEPTVDGSLGRQLLQAKDQNANRQDWYIIIHIDRYDRTLL